MNFIQSQLEQGEDYTARYQALAGVRSVRVPGFSVTTGAAALLTWALSVVSATTLAKAPSPGDAYLDGLRGSWIIQGTFGNKAVKYDAVGTRVLGGAWLQLHMVDAEKPPQYEADVFLGYDAKAGDFILHWLDTFGAAGARVVATGHRDGERLIVVFPYADGAFRDTFERDRSSGTWNLLIESQGKGGAWSKFSVLRFTRPSPAQ